MPKCKKEAKVNISFDNSTFQMHCCLISQENLTKDQASALRLVNSRAIIMFMCE